MKILLVVYDNDSYIHWFPIGLAYIASVIRKAGHEAVIYSQDVYHYSEEHLTKYLDENKFDAVGVSVIGGYYQYRKLLKISKAVNESKNRPFYIIGGHGPAPEPEFFFKKTGADAIVIGEGEISTINLLNALASHKDLSSVNGIAYMKNGKCVVNPRQELIKDIDSIPFPAWDMFHMDYYSLLRMPHIKNSERCFPVLSSRGCPFKCNFCYRMDKGIRIRSNESLIEEIKILKQKYNISYIAFGDELLMVNPQRTISLCEAFIKENLNIKWDCNGRLNFAAPEVLKIMKKAGCVFINYGIECFDDEILSVMNKNLTCEQIVKGIEATLAAEISPGYNIIFGNIGETAETLRKGVDFLLKYDDHSQFRTIRPVTPYPGSPLYYHAIEKGLIKDAEDFYENKHTNSDLMSVNFTKLSDDEYYKALHDANVTLINNYFDHQKRNYLDSCRRLYIERNSDFRGFRQS
ncbi:MAG TPA: radical SAM protein [Candidatus Wallbacteria bacterium]|nr:radical SAM protein [Candidatus Wallbacteria bacterium]